MSIIILICLILIVSRLSLQYRKRRQYNQSLINAYYIANNMSVVAYFIVLKKETEMEQEVICILKGPNTRYVYKILTHHDLYKRSSWSKKINLNRFCDLSPGQAIKLILLRSMENLSDDKIINRFPFNRHRGKPHWSWFLQPVPAKSMLTMHKAKRN